MLAEVSVPQLAVWGDPISHSRSPAMHRAAYRVLKRDWQYGRRQVDENAFDAALSSLDASWRGLSLTMPLKGVACRAAVSRDRPTELTGAANTLLLSDSGPRAFNTDVGGIVAALKEAGMSAPIDRARIIGAGATASSALLALEELGVRDIEVHARRPQAVSRIEELGEQVGVRVTGVQLGEGSAIARPEATAVLVTVATLPGGVRVPDAVIDALSGGLLMDVVYGGWPTSLGAGWKERGHPAISGEAMLLHQAVRQVRAFATGDPESEMDDEPSVIAAMRAALVED